MVGSGAGQFAKEAGIEIVDPSYFRTCVITQSGKIEIAIYK
jgi:hypothetical protein